MPQIGPRCAEAPLAIQWCGSSCPGFTAATQAHYPAAMGRDTGQWRCRLCGFERWHVVTVKRLITANPTCARLRRGCFIPVHPKDFITS